LVEQVVVERLEADADLGSGLAGTSFSLNSGSFVVTAITRDLGDDAGADGLAALADGEAHLLLERDGGDELDVMVTLSPGMTIFTSSAACRCPSRPSCGCRTAGR
jgi:hypothetical protein